jgi:2-desacetyl-2-hydroxyethyl bacteriochlorophyllide A dehydrogenase
MSVEARGNLPEKAPALVVSAHGQATLNDEPTPSPAAGQLLVETLFSGVSIGTEHLAATGKHHGWGEPPFVPGYQAVGTVVAFGEGVSQDGPLRLGGLVACFAKSSHRRFVVADVDMAHPVVDSPRLRLASLFVQPAVGANALNLAAVQAGDCVVVLGQGMVGQTTAQQARLRGAYVVGTDVSPDRIALARAHCVHRAIDATLGSVAEQLTSDFPDGCDIVIESTGLTDLIDDGMKCLRRGGTFVFEGFYPDGLHFDFMTPHVKQVRAVFPCFIGGRRLRESVLELILSGELDLEPLVTATVPWTEACDVYQQLFTEERATLNGVVIDWR